VRRPGRRALRGLSPVPRVDSRGLSGGRGRHLGGLMFSLSPRPLEDILAILFAFVVATTIHEFMHAWTALKLGDTTARDQGRITLDPVSHFDPLGFFGMVMISIGYPFIGWGKPVPVAPWKMTKLPRDQRRRG